MNIYRDTVEVAPYRNQDSKLVCAVEYLWHWQAVVAKLDQELKHLECSDRIVVQYKEVLALYLDALTESDYWRWRVECLRKGEE